MFRVAPPGGAGPPTTERVRVVLDGYNAPLSAGNFLDLAQKGFYDGMDVQRADGFVVQSGDPAGPDIGYVVGGKVRTVPLEIMVQGDRAPLYGSTLEDVRRFREQPALPFNAFGTLAAARSEFDNDSASSQFFFLLKESELTPSGTNSCVDARVERERLRERESSRGRAVAWGWPQRCSRGACLRVCTSVQQCFATTSVQQCPTSFDELPLNP